MSQGLRNAVDQYEDLCDMQYQVVSKAVSNSQQRARLSVPILRGI